MNSNFERKNTQPTTMAEMQAMQRSAMRHSMDKAENIQKAIMLTEENWTGLTSAVSLTGQSVLKLQESVGHLLTDEQMDAKLKEQVQTLLAEHSAAVTAMQTEVQNLNESSARHLRQVQKTMTDSLNTMRREQEEVVKEFRKQVGRASEEFSSKLSRATNSVEYSAGQLKWQMYLPTIILVLWELVRHLFLLD